MADKTVTVANKPVMRGLLHAQIKKNIFVALVLSGIGGFAWQQLVGNARKKRYAEFYRNYDPEKEFEEMRSKGLFQSC